MENFFMKLARRHTTLIIRRAWFELVQRVANVLERSINRVGIDWV
jgi:hypothetical protein